MNRFAAMTVVMLLFTDYAGAQLWKSKRYEAMGGLGTSQFFGDIGGFSKTDNILGIRDFSFRQTRFNLNGGFKYRITQNLSAKIGLAFGMFHATDSRGSNENRLMSATTAVFEPSLTGEFYFIKSQMENSYLFSRGRRTRFDNILSALDVYAFTGLGGLSYSVKGNDVLVARGMKEGGFTAVIPAGIGINMLFLPDYNFGLELGGRYAFSDYLEGYTSPYSRSNDVYYFFSFTFTYKILTGRNGLPAFLNRGRRF